jgi:hypothetical protein
MNEAHPSPTAGFDLTSLGLASYLATNSEYLQFPVFSLTNYQSLGSSGANLLPSQSLQLYVLWPSVIKNHTLKIGVDARQYKFERCEFWKSYRKLLVRQRLDTPG